MELKDKAKAKLERRAAKAREERTTKGPQIAWDEAVRAVTDDDLPAPTAQGTLPGTPVDDTTTDDDQPE